MESTREKWRKFTPPHPNVTNISNLPEDLLVHIISFLPIKDAIATSFLSKAWINLWTHSPSLDFKYDLIVPHDYHSDNPDDDWRTNDAERAKIYASFVDQALQRYHPPNLRSLSINFSYDDHVAHHVDNWLQIAARNNIQELNVDFFIYLFNLVPHLYNLSLSFLSSASLTTLSLHHLRLVSSSGATFRSLRTLSLFDVDFGNEIMLDLIAGCPELQNLALNICLGMHHLKISSSRLKNLSIINCGSRRTSFEIDAPNLISFECQNDLPTVDNYSFKDLSSLVNARVMFGYLPQFSNNETHGFNRLRKTPEVFASARILTLQNCWGEHFLWKIQNLQQTVTYNVEYLELTMDFSKFQFLGLAIILNHSANLGTVIVHHFPGKYESDVLQSYIPGCLPRLKIFKIDSYGVGEKEMQLEIELAKLLLKHGTELEEMTLACRGRSNFLFLVRRYEELQNFPRSSKHAKISIVDLMGRRYVRWTGSEFQSISVKASHFDEFMFSIHSS